MKWFWYSLLVFCLLMCSCRTKKFGREVDFTTKEDIHTELSRFELFTDTSNVLKIGIDQSKLKIIETIITKRYDKDTGVITEETTTEREIAQDSNEVVAETEEKGVTEENDILVKHESDFSKTTDSEETLESIGAQESFGKWFGIVSACFIGLFLIYLWRKFRVS